MAPTLVFKNDELIESLDLREAVELSVMLQKHYFI